MSGLVLKLRASERVVVNGATLEALGRPARLRVLTRDADILRLRDAIDPSRADTPVGRLCHIVQLMVAGEADAEMAVRDAQTLIEPLRIAFGTPAAAARLDEAARLLALGRPYPALRLLKPLLREEARLLGETA